MVEEKSFGFLKSGKEAKLYTLTNASGISVSITDYGAAIVSIKTADRNGEFADVVLGFDCAGDYEKQNGAYMGATIGRCANRLRGGKFMLGGVPVLLNCNDGSNHLHGGKEGFDKKLWSAQVKENAVAFTYVSADGEENYPGTLKVTVEYSLLESNALNIEYRAVSDKDTLVNLTNHSYFNLAGHDKQNACDQILRINADRFTCIDTDIIPDGTVTAVECTPLDFRYLERIKSRIGFDYKQLRNAGGYDHNFVLNKRERNIMSLAAELYDESSGRFMALHTTLPGLQFYSGNFLDCIEGKGGALYMKNGGICLEPQLFPNAMEHTHFPSPILRAGEEYRHMIRYTFSVKELKTTV